MKKIMITLTLIFASIAANAINTSALKSYDCYLELKARPYATKTKAVCWKGKDSAVIETYVSLVKRDDPFREKCLVDPAQDLYVSAGYVKLRHHQNLKSEFHERPDLPYFGLLGATPNTRTHEIANISRSSVDVGGSIDHNFVGFNFLTRSGETKKISIDFTYEVGTMTIDSKKIEFGGCLQIVD